MSTLLEQYDRALAEVDMRVVLVQKQQWSDPTPCPGWDVRVLVAHLVDEQRRVPFLLGGVGLAEAGDRFSGDPLGEDPPDAWHRESRAAREAFHTDGALDCKVASSYGDTSARDYLWEMTCDLAVHAWDLARGIGADEHLDAELVRRIHNETQRHVDSLAARGLFDPPVAVAAHVDLQTRMLALFGRRA